MTQFSETAYDRSYESLEGIPPEDLMSLIRVKTEHAISLDGIQRRLEEGEIQNVKFGTDPTGPDLHLGHVVPLRVLDIFSRAGHNVDLIFGDFTAKVGDPTGRSNERTVLTDEQIAANMTTFQDQVDRYFDTRRDNVRVHTNSSWLGNMALSEVFGYLQAINLTEATQRNDFRDRMQNGHAVSLAETMYGTLMGIDSVQLNTDIEIGGLDQLLNFQQTRTVQRSQGQKPEEIIMTPIIQGTSGDGRKMSKSYGNYVAVRADTNDVFGKIMSIPDTLIVPYIKAFVPVYEAEVAQLEQTRLESPLELKKQLATYMAAVSAGEYAQGLAARESFESRFANKVIDVSDIRPLAVTGLTLREALFGSGDYASKTAIGNLAKQGGIKIDGTPVSFDDLSELTRPGSIVIVGSKKNRKAYSIANEDE